MGSAKLRGSWLCEQVDYSHEREWPPGHRWWGWNHHWAGTAEIQGVHPPCGLGAGEQHWGLCNSHDVAPSIKNWVSYRIPLCTWSDTVLGPLPPQGLVSSWGAGCWFNSEQTTEGSWVYAHMPCLATPASLECIYEPFLCFRFLTLSFRFQKYREIQRLKCLSVE